MDELPRRSRVNTDGRGFAGSPSSPRPRTPNNNLHPDWRHQYTPPQSPYRPSSSSSLNKIRELEHEIQAYRLQLRDMEYFERDFQDLQVQYDRLSADFVKVHNENRDLSLRISEIDHDNHVLQQRLDAVKHERRESDDNADKLASAHKQILEYEKTTFLARKSTEDKTLQLAQLYSNSRKHHLAALEYKELMHHMEAESKLRAKLKDHERKQEANEARYLFEFECAKALAAGDKLEEAEKHFQSVLNAEETLSRTRSNRIDVDDLTLRLAKVISLQDRQGDAKRIHFERMHPLQSGTLDQQPQEKRDYVLRHATNYYSVLIKEKNYDDAMYHLRKIWAQKSGLTVSAMQEIEALVWKSIDILESRNQSTYLLEVLIRVCDVPSSTSQSVFELKSMSRLGTLLLYRREPDPKAPQSLSNHDHAHAFRYLQRSWSNRQRLDHSLFIATGWAFTLTSLCLQKYNIAEGILEELQSEMNDDASVTRQPSQAHISALLAHCHLKAGNFAAAEKTAQEVFQRHGLENIFQHLEIPSTLNVSEYHQANTLMLARTKQKQKAKFEEAQQVWNRIYDAKSKGWDGIDRAGLQSHLKVATVLANEWTVFVKKKTPTKGPAIQKEVDQLKKVLAKYPNGYTKAHFDKVCGA